MQIHVARAGKELGIFSQEEVRNRLASGEFLPTDHGWAEGQADWKLLSAFPGLIPTKPLPPPPEPMREIPPRPEPGRGNRRREKKASSASAQTEPLPGVSPNVEPAPTSAALPEESPSLLAKSEPAPEAQPSTESAARLPLELEPEPPAKTEPEPELPVSAQPEPELLSPPEAEPEDVSSEPDPGPEPEPEPVLRVYLKSDSEHISSSQAEPPRSVPAERLTLGAAPLSRPIAEPKPAPFSHEAISSLILGILSISLLPVLTALPAVILGRIAVKRIERSRGALRGLGMAHVGLISGYIGTVLAAIALLAAFTLAIMGYVQTKNAQAESLDHGRTIAAACRMYAVDHQGAFPQTLDALVPNYVPDQNVFLCPFTGPSEPIGYEYYGGKASDPATKVVLVSKGFTARKRHVVVYADGSAVLLKIVREPALNEPAP